MAFDDDLLAELDELGGDDQMDVAEGGANTVADIAALGEASGAGGIDEEHEALIGRIASSAASIHAIATLGRSSELRALLDDVARSQQTPVANRMVVGRAEDDPDYRLVLRANEMSARIAGEALVTHRFLVDHYRARFPELETLVRNPLEYARTVKAIGASADISKVELGSVLPNATQMVVALTGSTSSGRLLGAD
ncbi:U4/U6-U5 snRNP complex subunit prp31, partial [Coemansia nantahalensis]